MTEGIQEDMKTELISVIIPVYKVEKYINRVGAIINCTTEMREKTSKAVQAARTVN